MGNAMNTKLRDALDTIQEMLLDNEINGQLWDILCALRGPDNLSLDPEVKEATTAIIRSAAFPKRPVVSFAIFSGNEYTGKNNDSDKYAIARMALEKGHFQGHAIRAFSALGLSWDKVNGEEYFLDYSKEKENKEDKEKK